MMRPRPAPMAARIGDLAPAAGGADEQQVGDVGAGDQQHEADGADQHEQRRAHVADERLAQRLDAEAAVLARAPWGTSAVYSSAESCSRALACSSVTPGSSRPATGSSAPDRSCSDRAGTASRRRGRRAELLDVEARAEHADDVVGDRRSAKWSCRRCRDRCRSGASRACG